MTVTVKISILIASRQENGAAADILTNITACMQVCAKVNVLLDNRGSIYVWFICLFFSVFIKW